MSSLLFLVYFLALCFFLYRFMVSRPKGFPPGPPRWPIVGSLLHLYWRNYKLPFMAAHQWVKEFKAPVMGLYLGDTPNIIVNDPDLIKEVFTRPEFQGRPWARTAELRSLTKDKTLGVIFTDGDEWSEQKRYALRNFRDFGYGRRSEAFESVLEEETRNIITLINDKNPVVVEGENAKVPELFYLFNLNMIMNVFDGVRFTLDQLPEAVKLVDTAFTFLKHTEPTGGAVNFMPWLEYLFPKSVGVNGVSDTNSAFNEFLGGVVQRSKKNHSSELLRGYVDVFLEKMKNGKNTHPSFTEENLINILVDFWLPAVTTVTGAQGFLLEYLLYHPEIQRKMQEEIDRVAGRGRLPTLQDRRNMPFVEATVREALRLKPIVVLAVTHKCTQEGKLGDYVVPKETLLVPNLYNHHRDEKLWKNPNIFDPTRFLDSNGEIIKKDPSLPFGIGKRVCPGETFARQNLFVTTAAFFQHFSIECPPGILPPNLNDLRNGVNLSPNPFKVKIVHREK